MKSVYEGIQEKIGEIKDLTDSVHKMLDDVKRNISTRKNNILTWGHLLPPRKISKELELVVELAVQE